MDRRRRQELAAGTARSFHGLAVIMHRAELGHTEACLRKVREALDLLSEHAPEHLAGMRDRFAGIFVWNGLVAAVGRFSPTERLCELDCAFVERDTTSTSEVALTLVHEATHARLRAGAAAQRLDVAEEEALCISAELDVARCLPGAAVLVQDANRRLARPATFYAPSAQYARGWAELESTAPNALMAALVRYFARRSARRHACSVMRADGEVRSDARAG